ncbi:MAG: carbamate kinase [Gemmatimonadota bacterium]
MTRGERTVVVAIGGNALSPAGESAAVSNQFRHTRESLTSIVEFAREGWRIAVVHGNGPQVGDALLRNERASDVVSPLPLGVLVAATAGSIGYMIQQSLQNALERAGVSRRVVTVVTQVLVDPEDPSLRSPSKFIGRTLSAAAAERLQAEGVLVHADAKGGLRRVVASPEPIEIVEAGVVEELVNRGDIVIAAGGGGIPAYRDPRLGLEGVDAVVDKDRAAAILAEAIGARVLLILTDVDGVYERFGRPEARRIPRLTISAARARLSAGGGGGGSLGPKLEAAVSFVERGGERAVIGELADGPAALGGRTGTTIVADASDGSRTRKERTRGGP